MVTGKNVCNLLSIGNKTVTIDAHPMRLVHSLLYQPCTACIGSASIVTVSSPTKTKNCQNFVCWFFFPIWLVQKTTNTSRSACMIGIYFFLVHLKQEHACDKNWYQSPQSYWVGCLGLCMSIQKQLMEQDDCGSDGVWAMSKTGFDILETGWVTDIESVLVSMIIASMSASIISWNFHSPSSKIFAEVQQQNLFPRK